MTTLSCIVSQKIFDEKFDHSKYGKTENGQVQGKISKRRQLNPTIQHVIIIICIPNMTFLACKVVENFFTKKCYGITEGRTDGRNDGQM